jgi:hypothetical protein
MHLFIIIKSLLSQFSLVYHLIVDLGQGDCASRRHRGPRGVSFEKADCMNSRAYWKWVFRIPRIHSFQSQ